MKFWRQYLGNMAQHKYAIRAELLGDCTALPWSNLGDWSGRINQSNTKLTYPQACQNLAQRLAQALNLNSKDWVLDLACGHGASLHFWQQHYALEHLEGVELQLSCVQNIQQHLPHLHGIHQLNFLNLKMFEFKKFDVVMCIDAAYHVDLNSFLNSVNSVLNSKARLGFHTLVWSDQYLNSNLIQRKKYHWLLRAADIQGGHLRSKQQLIQQLEQMGFEHIRLQNLSEAVLKGFADYIEQDCPQNLKSLDGLKIALTAKLCRRLYEDGLLHYVQVTAQKIA